MPDSTTSPLRCQGPWTKEQAHSFFDRSVIPMRLAANTPSGFPVVLSLWFLRDGDDLVGAVHRDAKIAHRLQQDPRCAYEVAPNQPPYMGVRGRSHATLTPEGSGAILERLLLRYLGTTDSSLGNFLLSRVEEELTLRLRLASLTSWDYRARMEDASG